MIASTFQAFTASAQEKHITLRIELESLDEFIDLHLPQWRHQHHNGSSAKHAAAAAAHASTKQALASIDSMHNPISGLATANTTPTIPSQRLFDGSGGSNGGGGGNNNSATSEGEQVSTTLVLGDQFRIRQVLSNFLSNASVTHTNRELLLSLSSLSLSPLCASSLSVCCRCASVLLLMLLVSAPLFSVVPSVCVVPFSAPFVCSVSSSLRKVAQWWCA
jgi:hypothetical protein